MQMRELLHIRRTRTFRDPRLGIRHAARVRAFDPRITILFEAAMFSSSLQRQQCCSFWDSATGSLRRRKARE